MTDRFATATGTVPMVDPQTRGERLGRFLRRRARAGWSRVRSSVGQAALVGRRLAQVEHRLLLVVVDVDQLGRVPSLGRGACRDDRDDLTGVRDPVDGDGGVHRGLLVLGDRPRAGQAALLVGEVAPGPDADHARALLGLVDVDAADRRRGERAAHHRDVHHAGEHDVVGPPGATGDQPLVLLAAAGLPDLAARLALLLLRGSLGGGHLRSPPAAAPDSATEATALTMFW